MTNCVKEFNSSKSFKNDVTQWHQSMPSSSSFVCSPLHLIACYGIITFTIYVFFSMALDCYCSALYSYLGTYCTLRAFDEDR